MRCIFINLWSAEVQIGHDRTKGIKSNLFWGVCATFIIHCNGLKRGLKPGKTFIVDIDESKKCLKWICNYIGFQANKPAPSHVRDLHSIIVAAFNCLSQWILNHHWLLDDEVLQ